MRKLLLVTAIAAALPLSAMAKPFVAKNLGQGFTGVTGDFTHAQSNPALLAKFQENDDVYLAFGGGALGSDQDELIDAIEQTQDLIDEIESTPLDQLDQSQADALKMQLADMSGDSLALDQGLNLMIAVPMNWASLGIYVNQEARIETAFDYDDSDADYIDDFVAGLEGTEFDADNLNSGATVIGFSVAEAGLTIAKTYKGESVDVNYGTNLKYQRLDLFNYSEKVSTFDEDNFDADQYLVDDAQFNADIGLQIGWGDKRQWQFGLVAKDILGFDLESSANPISGEVYKVELDPTATAGLSYDNGWFRIAVDADLMPHSDLVPTLLSEESLTIAEVQYASAGIELDAWEWAQLRVGYRTDMESSVEDVITAGIGFSPFDVLSLDISGAMGDNDTYGGAIQLGVKF